MQHQKLLMVGGLLGSLALAGCGISGHVNATPADNGTSQVSGTVHTSPSTSGSSSSSPSPAISPSESSNTGSVTPNSSPPLQPSTSASPSTPTPMNLSSITYAINQQATIFQLGHKVGFPAAYVPRQGFNSKFVRATTFTAATSHKSVLMLTYNNFTVQESGKANSFGTGGDHVPTGSVQLTIPGSGSRAPIMGTWTTDYGIQGSGTHSFLTFRMNGVYYDIMSNTLSEAQINKIAESFSET